MADNNVGPTKWTETEKLDLILQIVAKSGKIPWDELDLPAGRTMKACQVMLDKEKSKVKKARETEEGAPDAAKSPAKNKKRAKTETSKPAKKARTKKEAAQVKAESDDEAKSHADELLDF